MMQYKIEKNVPIPSSKNHKNSLKPFIDMAIKMKDGDSVELTNIGNSNSLAQAINQSYQSYQDINFKQKYKAIRRKIRYTAITMIVHFLIHISNGCLAISISPYLFYFCYYFFIDIVPDIMTKVWNNVS